MKIMIILWTVAVFLLGFLSSFFIGGQDSFERPFTGYAISDDSLESPSDFFNDSDFRVYKDRIVIFVDGATISNYADTGSMLPLIDKGANGIRIKPESEEDINLGDIISFRRNGKLIVHRVVEIGFDIEGIYFLTQGDNSFLADEKIRFDDIEYKTVGVLY